MLISLVTAIALLQVSVSERRERELDADPSSLHKPRELTTQPRQEDYYLIRIHVEYLDSFTMGSTEATTYMKDTVILMAEIYLESIVRTQRVIGDLPTPNSCGSVTLPDTVKNTKIPDADILFVFGNLHYARVDLCGYVGPKNNPGTVVLYIDPSVADKSYMYQLNHVLQQMIYGLGFRTDIIGNFQDSNGNSYNLESVIFDSPIRGVSMTLIALPTVLSKARELFGCPSLIGVPLETNDSTGLLHWDMRTMFNDVMATTIFYDSIVSPVTFAFLEDTGWYTMDWSLVYAPPFGNGKGCEFVLDKCIDNGSAQSPEFCESAEAVTCNIFHTAPGQCNLQTYSSDLDANYQYFSDPKLGGAIEDLDFCPVSLGEEEMDCRNPDRTVDSIYGETVGYGSRCLVTTLVQTGHTDTSTRTGCFQVTECKQDAAVVRVGNEETGYKSFDCPFTGGTVEWPEHYTGQIQCPDSNILCMNVPCVNDCLNTGVCVGGNCDCDNGRFGVDCSSNCGQITGCNFNCDSQGNCLDCQSIFYLIDGRCERCDSLYGCTSNCSSDGLCEECMNGYYLENGSCKLCSELGCQDNCAQDGSCTDCLTGYFLEESACKLCAEIDGCLDCQQDGTCLECSDEYYKYNSKCELCTNIVGCTSCDEDGVCEVCEDVYFKSEGACSLCTSIPNCTENCDEEGKCTLCKDGFYKNNDGCTACTDLTGCTSDCTQEGVCSVCEQYYYNYQDGCKQCTDLTGCTQDCEASGKCTTCLDSYYNQDGTCLLCTSIDGCLDCDSTGYCLSCDTEYFKDEGTCSTCVSLDGCSSDCTSDGKCNACLDSYYNDAGVCKECTEINGCTDDCNQDGSCNSCKDCFIWNNGVCDKCEICAEDIGECCASNQYAKSNACVDCPLQCTTCTSQDRCIVCADGTGDCCNSNQFFNGSQCEDCPGDCETCDDHGVCTSCKDGVDFCCPDGEYYSNSFCVVCPDPCSICDIDAVCTGCKYFGTEPDCCNSHQYLLNGVCTDCHEDCKLCTADGQCASCEHLGSPPTCCAYEQVYTDGVCLDCFSDRNYEDEDCVPLGHYFQSSEFIEKVEFDDSHIKLIVSFSETPTFIDVFDFSDCSFYFLRVTVALLGDGPVCQYISFSNSLEVTLGFNFDLRNDHEIHFNGLHMQKGIEKVDRNYRPILKSIAAKDYPSPSISIRSPSHYYKDCNSESLELSVEVQNGIANGDISYEWIMTPSDLTYLTERILVPSSSLQPSDYTFKVTVSNHLGKSVSKSTTVSVIFSSALSVIFDTGSSIEFSKTTESLLIRAEAIGDCQDSGQANFSWENESTDSLSYSTFSNKLIVRRDNMIVGNSYTLKATATSGSVSGTGLLTITVVQSPLVCEINHATRSVSSGRDLELDGTGSYDPDGSDLEYEWYCEDHTGRQCRGVDGNPLISIENSTLSKFVIDRFRLKLGDILSVYLSIQSTDGRKASSSSTLTVVDAGNTEIEVLEYEYKVSAHQELLIELEVTNGSSVNWSQFEGPLLNPSSSTDMPSLLFAANSMQEGQTYRFLATIAGENGQGLLIYITWITNQGPQCEGSIYKINTNGLFNTIGITGCYDRDEEDGPLIYSYGVFYDYSFPTVYQTFSDSIVLWMTPGDKKVIVKVCDQMNSCHESKGTINVPNNRRILQEAQFAYNEGKTETDMIPHLIIEILNFYTINAEEWLFFYNELEGYTNLLIANIGALEENTVTTLIGTTVTLMLQDQIDSDSAIKGLGLCQKIIDNAQDKLNDLDASMLVDMNQKIHADFPSFLNVTSEIMSLQSKLNKKQIENYLPSNDPIIFAAKDSTITSVINRTWTEDIGTYNLTGFSGDLIVSMDNIMIEKDNIVDTEIMVLKGANSSDIISMAMYSLGSYDRSTVDLNMIESSDPYTVENFTNSINITIPFITHPEKDYGVYYLMDSWVHDSNIDVELTDNHTAVHFSTTYLHTFTVAEYTRPEEPECSYGLALIFVAVGSFLVFIVGVTVYRLMCKGKSQQSQSIDRREECELMIEEVWHEKFRNNYLLTSALMCKSKKFKLNKGFELWISLLMNLAVSGWLLALFENADEDSDKDHANALEYPIVFFSSAFLVFMINSLLRFSIKYFECLDYNSMKILQMIFNVLFVVLSFVSIFVLSFEICDSWNGLWAILFVLSLMIDLIFLQAFLALYRGWIYKRKI